MGNNLKAAVIAAEYNEGVFFGGGEKVNFYIIKELINQGFSVDVYAGVSYVKSSSIVNLFIRDKNFDVNYDNLVKNYDLVISFNLEYPADISLAHNHSFAYQTEKNPFIAFFECVFSKSYKKRIKKSKKAIINAQKTPKIVVSSNIVKEDYVKNYNISPDKIKVIPLGTDISNESANPETHVKSNPVVFGLCARKFQKKGGYIALFAAYKLKKLYKNFKIRIITDKISKNPILPIIIGLLGLKKNIELLPLQNDMSNFYRSIDFFLMPTLKDAFGLVVLEAMAFYKPVIISSLCGAVDIINDDINGIVSNFNHDNKIDNFFDKMNKAMKLNENDYKLMSIEAYKTAVKYPWDKFAHQFVDYAWGAKDVEV